MHEITGLMSIAIINAIFLMNSIYTQFHFYCLGIDRYFKNHLFCRMKLLPQSIRNFFEGFISFYTSIYDEMKRR